MSSFHVIDWLIIAAYIVAVMGVGFWIAKRASGSLKHYFLGGNQIPWYFLGVSNASGMFDISGTMLLVYWLFVYGLKSIWIPWVWPVFNQIFLMVFVSTWLRRSNVLTGAEWITFRFGRGRGATLAHLIVVVFALFNVFGFLAYGFIGIGKFAAVFLPWQLSADPNLNVRLWGLLITALTTIYVVRGGMFSVVFTEVLQYVLMTLGCLWLGAVAMRHVSPDMLDRFIPHGWRTPFFGRDVGLDWTGIMDAVNTRIGSDGYAFFSAFVMMTFFKGLILSGAGPAPNYDMQRILSARTPREAAKMSGFVTLVLMVPRYVMVTALTVLALVFFSGQLKGMGQNVDFELILPFALKTFVPAGLLGLLIAGLLAAFMSTYSATVNAAPAYIVNDIYRRYINPAASQKRLVYASYITSVLVVIVGTLIGMYVASLNNIVLWIVSALYGGYAASNFLKWYWWRFNAYGYFWGMVFGIAASMVVPAVLGRADALYTFPLIMAVSLVGCIAGSLLTEPDDEAVLKNFYLRVRPWGFWRPIHEKLRREYPALTRNRNFPRDMFNVAVGIVWQTALVATGIYVVLEDWRALTICAGLILLTSVILKFNWYDKLEDYPPEVAESMQSREGAAEPRVMAGAEAH